jgi:large subunit ribosomal protein L3
MKRHGFSGFMASHGVHESKRGPGSIGQSADPAKVFKGMKMPGQMGDETVTIQNLRVVDVRESQNLIMVKGPVPGGKNGLLIIHHAIKKEAPPLRQQEPDVADEPETEDAAVDAAEVEAPSEGEEAAAGEQAPESDASEETENAAVDSGTEPDGSPAEPGPETPDAEPVPPAPSPVEESPAEGGIEGPDDKSKES